MYDAKYDSRPVLAITGHNFHDLIGTHYQQDVDLDKLFMTMSHITIPKNIQEWTSDGEERSAANTA